MSKKNICRNCKAEMPKGTRVCPSCGARNKKPFYQRGWFIILAVLIVFFIIGSIGDKKEEYETKKEQESTEYRWPDNELAMMISQPESKLGKVQLESEESFMIDIYKVSYNQFEDYVVDCKGKGFTVDYSKTDNLFTAENEDGFSLMVAYSEEDEMMDITLDRPREITSEEETEEVGEEKSEISTEDSQNEETKAVEEVEKENKDEKAESDLVDGMRPEFKEAMDSYEAYYDEYCEFMKKYSETPDDLGMIADYGKMVAKLADMDAKFAAWNENEMNDAEIKYYAEVNARITKKLAEVATLAN